MGTRADFYIGRDKKAVWLASIAWDGYPEGIPEALRQASTEEKFKSALTDFLEDRTDVSHPGTGWPWPWADSRTTDFAYGFDDDAVWMCCFGHGWIWAGDLDKEFPEGEKQEFPDMTKEQNVALGERSGLIVIASK